MFYYIRFHNKGEDMNTREKKYAIQKVILWILICAWMLLIFGFSAQDADESSDLSEGFLRQFILWFLPERVSGNREILDLLEYLVRKCAHMAEFAVLGLLISIQMYLYGKFQNRWRWFFVAAALVMCYAATDEFHQLFVSGRSGRVTDVLIDTAGGTIGIAVFGIWKHFKKKNLVEDKQ